jgi:hypothetical protein
MEGMYDTIRYSSWSFPQKILFCFVNITLLFPEFFKSFFLHFLSLLPSNEDHDSTFVYSSLQSVHIPSPSHHIVVDHDQDTSSELHDNLEQSCRFSVSKTDILPSPSLNPVPSKLQERYKPLRFPYILHDFPLKHYKKLPAFDGTIENFSAEKHVQAFEHFLDLFEIEYEDVTLRAFSQSLQGKVKLWFKNLPPHSISSWDELREAFLRFWGEKKPLDLLLSDFYSIKKQEDETVSSFNRRFSSVYYELPKEIQPPEGAAKLYYATTLPSKLFLFLSERRSATLQQMFIDAQEVEDNLRAGRKLSYQDDGDKWRKEKEDQPRRVLEFSHEDVFIEDHNQPTNVSNFDGFQEAFSLPIYDEYQDEYVDIFLEQPTRGLAQDKSAFTQLWRRISL